MKSPMGRAAALVIGLCAAAVLTGCAAGRPAAAAPPRVPGQATGGPDLVGVKLPSFILPLVSGGVSRPNPRLTPGAVSETNTTVLCGLPKAATSVSVPLATGNALYAEYGYTTPEMQRKYTLDYLVPIDLGGATTKANIWPASMRGTGFYQKVQLDHVLRDLVCRRTLALATAQSALKADWYAAWLKYVVASGRS
jgi:hypothetical protein